MSGVQETDHRIEQSAAMLDECEGFAPRSIQRLGAESFRQLILEIITDRQVFTDEEISSIKRLEELVRFSMPEDLCTNGIWVGRIPVYMPQEHSISYRWTRRILAYT